MRPRSDPTCQQSTLELQAHITTNRSQSQPPIIYAIVGFQIGWTKEVFQKFNIPVINFITFSVCATAMELGLWKAQAGQFNPGEEARLIPGLLEEMAITPSDLKRKPLALAPVLHVVAHLEAKVVEVVAVRLNRVISHRGFQKLKARSR